MIANVNRLYWPKIANKFKINQSRRPPKRNRTQKTPHQPQLLRIWWMLKVIEMNFELILEHVYNQALLGQTKPSEMAITLIIFSVILTHVLRRLIEFRKTSNPSNRFQWMHNMEWSWISLEKTGKSVINQSVRCMILCDNLYLLQSAWMAAPISRKSSKRMLQ